MRYKEIGHRTPLRILLFIFFLSGCTPQPASDDNLRVYFSPQNQATNAIVEAINTANKTILIQAYSFTSQPISDAVIQAHKRGLTVIVLLDKSQVKAKNSVLKPFQEAGVNVLIDKKHSIAHNKIMLLDGYKIITGSFNFTKNAQYKNAENMLIITNKPDLFTEYQKNFEIHKAHSVAMEAVK